MAEPIPIHTLLNLGVVLISVTLRTVHIDNVFEVKMPASGTCASHYCTCLGHLGWGDKNRNDPICVAPPKVAKASS